MTTGRQAGADPAAAPLLRSPRSSPALCCTAGLGKAFDRFVIQAVVYVHPPAVVAADLADLALRPIVWQHNLARLEHAGLAQGL